MFYLKLIVNPFISYFTALGQVIGKPLPPTNCGKIPTPQQSLAVVAAEQQMKQSERENNSSLNLDHRNERDRLTPHHNFVPDLRDLRTSVPSSVLPPPLYQTAHPLSSNEQIKKCHSAIQQQCNALQQQHMNSALRNLSQHMAPSVYEMAALTQDLDTQMITTKIKEALLANNIGQKVGYPSFILMNNKEVLTINMNLSIQLVVK